MRPVSGDYHTEWSGPANSFSWDWFFANLSSDPVTIQFSVYCVPGS